jgi:hypothetical protein
MDFKSIVLGASALILSSSVNAAVITHGALSANDDGTSNIITDSLNDYEWLRFDVLASLTRSETLAVLNTQDGGGWSIADASKALLFINAILSNSTNSCSLTTSTQGCGAVAGWSEGDFGDNYVSSGEIVWYESDVTEAGFIFIDDSGYVSNETAWGDYVSTDGYSASGSNQDVSWLLYREVATVPVPAAIWLFGSGLLGLVGMARHKSA